MYERHDGIKCGFLLVDTHPPFMFLHYYSFVLGMIGFDFAKSSAVLCSILGGIHAYIASQNETKHVYYTFEGSPLH